MQTILFHRRLDDALDPVDVGRHFGVDPWVAPQRAAAAPRHDAAEDLVLPLAAGERAAGVALARVVARLAGAHHGVGLELAAVGSLAICRWICRRKLCVREHKNFSLFQGPERKLISEFY